MKIEKIIYETYNGDFKEEYLGDQWINLDQISYAARLGWRIDSIMFLADSIKTLISMATDSSNLFIIGKILSAQ